jgi:hypothetical protein
MKTRNAPLPKGMQDSLQQRTLKAALLQDKVHQCKTQQQQQLDRRNA